MSIGFLSGVQYQKYVSPVPRPDIEGVDFSVLWETWNNVEGYYLRPLDYQKMVYGAAEGMVASLDDPYTVFFDPKDSEIISTSISGDFEGVGMEVEMQDKILTVVAPLDDTPAQKAGMRAKDIILEIDGETTKGLTLHEAVSKIRGEKGTQVNLKILRNSELKEIKITRGTIELPTIKYEVKEYNGTKVGYMKIYQFTNHTLKSFQEETLQLKRDKIKHIIVDLRNNPGGLLDQAYEVSSFFLEKDKIVLVEGKGKINDEEVYKTIFNGMLSDPEIKVICLVNGGTASGAEIMAAAIRDNNRGELVGVKTFGKGSVQTPLIQKDDSMLKVTIAQWMTPNKEIIDGEGIEPDHKVEMTEEDYENENDPQLDKALDIITNIQ